MPISHPFPQLSFVGKRNRWAFPEKSPHAFPTSLLLPLPLGNAAPWLSWQPRRADLLLPVGQRHRTRAVGLPLAPVLWISMGCSWHMLHRPRDAHVVLRKASTFYCTPHPQGSCSLLGCRTPCLSSHHASCICPLAVSGTCLMRNPHPFLSTPHPQP